LSCGLQREQRECAGIADAWNGLAEPGKLLVGHGRATHEKQWSVVIGVAQQDPRPAHQVAVCIREPNGTTHVSSQGWPGAAASAQAGMTSELLDKLRRALP
jgi:hypothetical protein